MEKSAQGDAQRNLAWLLEGDPAIAFQAQRDLQHRPARIWQATRARVPKQGWGQRLLAARAKDGTWGGGLYSPKWTSTFYSLRLLYWLGADGKTKAAKDSCALLLDEGVQGDGGVRLWASPSSDCCVTAMLLALATRLGHARDARVDAMLQWLLSAQRPDGGWNCQASRSGARASSFHTSLSALEALTDVAATSPRRAASVRAAQEAGFAYFLRHRLYRSERTGQVVKDSFTRFSFPPRWYFDVLRALDAFRAAQVPWDERLADAVALVEARRGDDGRWRNQNHHPGREFFRLEPPRAASRWNTLRAMRVLRWVEAVRPHR